MEPDRRGRATRTPAQLAGDAAERHAEAHLVRLGWTILGRNVRVGRHELDLVATDPGPPAMLVVVEVRWRRSRTYGSPEETVDRRKRVRVRTGALSLVGRGELPGGRSLPRLALRLDLIVLEPDGRLRHHRAAI